MDYKSLDRWHLLAGLIACWIVGIGRYWDDTRATPLQQTGVGSVIYVFVLTAVLWVTAKPMDPSRFTYFNILTAVTLTAPPAVLYALPVERWVTLETANQLNLLFLAVVACWRVALWIRYLRLAGNFLLGSTFIAATLPLVFIFGALTALNLQHVVINVMGGIREADESSQDAAFGAIVLLTLLSLPVAIVSGIGWLVCISRRRGRKEVEKNGAL